MSICPHTHHQCCCQPQEGIQCPYGPTPQDYPVDDPVETLEKNMTKQISEERLRNTRAWAAARPDMSGSEVIVGAIDELILLRRVAEVARTVSVSNKNGYLEVNGMIDLGQELAAYDARLTR